MKLDLDKRLYKVLKTELEKELETLINKGL